MNAYSRINAIIDLDAAEYNFDQMYQNLIPGSKMAAVIKADGYGHGAVPIGKLAEKKEYIWGYAVATAEEAYQLKNAGLLKPILILGYSFVEHYKKLIESDVRICVFKESMAQQISDLASSLKKKAKIHLAIDTGMGRIGFMPTEESISDIKKIASMEAIEIEGIFTHFARADEYDVEPAYNQLEKFHEFLYRLDEEGIHIPIHHCCNSAGIIRMKDANLDMVRAGISIYGMYPSDEVETEPVDLKPVMSIISHIAYIKVVDAGTEISYGGTFTTNKKTVVATIPVGYADGYPRLLSNKGYVLIHGKKAPILGRVCMDQFMVDITHIPEANELDEVVLVGKSNTEEIKIEDLSAICGRFNYEFVCDISKRVPRTYVYHGNVIEQIDYFE